MDATEKIILFDSYEGLIGEIKEDMEASAPLRCRYPVRFIILNNFNIWHRLAMDLAGLGIKTNNLEDLIAKNRDRWITSDELVNVITECGDKTVVTPFSELVRFYSDADFMGIFNEIILTEDIDHPQKRIYIPLIGLQNRFTGFLNGFARIEESAPIWAYLDKEQKTNVFVTEINKDKAKFAERENVKCLDTLYDWLCFWKKQAPQQQIVCFSAPVNHRWEFADPDNIFTFKPIRDTREYIESLLGIDVPVKYKDSEEKYWSELLSDILKRNPAKFSFFSFVSSRFGLSEESARDLLFRWVQTDTVPYDRWLLKNYFVNSTEAAKYPYLKTCLEEISTYDNQCEIFSKIAERIFFLSDPALQMRYAVERESLIKRLPELFIRQTTETTRNYIRTCLCEIGQNNIRHAITLTTGIFEFEKVLLTAWYADRTHTGLEMEEAANKYHGLGMYLSDFETTEKRKENWPSDYLGEYREAKISDTVTEKIRSYIATKNRDENTFYGWYHSFNESHDLLCRHKASTDLCPDRVYWVDALGAEFLPYITSLIKDSRGGYRVIHSEIARCTIPSVTALNRFDDVKKFEELDRIAHDSSGYRKAETLVRELQAIADIIRKIINDNIEGEHTITIVSDHGLSCLSRLADSKKYDEKTEHDGRYIKVADGRQYTADPDCVMHTNENDGNRYKVALTHSSLGRRPIHEVHGGCTPEEVLVPYVIITNKTKNLKTYEYELITKEINISDPIVAVNVMPQPAEVKLHINDREFNLTRAGSRWSVRVDNLEEREYKLEFSIPGGLPFRAKIKVIGTGFGGNNFLDF